MYPNRLGNGRSLGAKGEGTAMVGFLLKEVEPPQVQNGLKMGSFVPFLSN